MMLRLSVLLPLVLILSACAGPSSVAATPTLVKATAATVPTPAPLSVINTPTVSPPTATLQATPPPEPTPTTETESAVESPPQNQPDFNANLDYAQVVFVKATQSGQGAWRFDATVRHNDQGWDHYADLWNVVDLEGNVFGERVLLHPHDTEQPFTRSQGNIEIPPDVTQVIVRAKCNVHGFGGQEVLVDLTVGQGENFEVAK